MALFAVLAGIVGAVLYSSGISAPLYLDDPTVLDNAETYIGTRTLGYVSFSASHKLADLLGYIFPWDVTIYYRIPNILIHILASIAVFWLARELTGRRLTAGLAGALFLVHPIQTQAVTYISQRFESQAALFMFVSAAAYIRFRRGHSRYWIVLAILAGLSAAMTKETTVALPLWLALIEICFFSGFSRLKHIALWLPFVAAVAYPAWKALQGAGKTLVWIPFELYLLSQGPVLLQYLELIFVPGKQYLLYDFPAASGLTRDVLAAWGLLLALVAMTLYLGRRKPIVIFGILTFFILLSPTSVVPLPDLIFEHRVYPAFAGIAIALAAAFPPRRLTVALFSIVFVFLGYRTFVRNGEWNDRVKFWEAHREAFPYDVKVLGSLAGSLAKVGEVKKAIAVNLEAQKYLDRLNPFYYKEGALIVSLNLATLYGEMDDGPRALEQARLALSVEPDMVMALRIVSRVQLASGDYEGARKTLQRLIASDANLETLKGLRAVESNLRNTNEVQRLDLQISGIENIGTGPSIEATAPEKPPRDVKSERLKGMTTILFVALVLVMGFLIFAFTVLKRHTGEVLRWVWTGSTVSVDSLAVDLPKQ